MVTARRLFGTKPLSEPIAGLLQICPQQTYVSAIWKINKTLFIKETNFEDVCKMVTICLNLSYRFKFKPHVSDVQQPR